MRTIRQEDCERGKGLRLFIGLIAVLILVFACSEPKREKINYRSLGTRALSELANRGDAEAQVFLGDKLMLGTAADFKGAVTWFEKAATAGHPMGEFKLGLAYLNGLGISMDKEKGVYWIKQAAEQRNHLACEHLGKMYLEGDGLLIDNERAYYWLLNASKLSSEADLQRINESLAQAKNLLKMSQQSRLEQESEAWLINTEVVDDKY